MTAELVTVRQCLNVNEAELAKMELEANGIRAYIADETIVAMDLLIGNAVGWIKVQVDAADADAAKEVLGALERLTVAETVADEKETDVCLACGARLEENRSTCARCGWSYAQDVDAD
jgi:hypothetical protein